MQVLRIWWCHDLQLGLNGVSTLKTSQMTMSFLSIYLTIHVATYHLQTLLKRLAASLWITSFDNQLATSLVENLQQTCRQQALASHANTSNISLIMTSLRQGVNRFTCSNLRVFGCIGQAYYGLTSVVYKDINQESKNLSTLKTFSRLFSRFFHTFHLIIYSRSLLKWPRYMKENGLKNKLISIQRAVFCM